VLPTAQTPKPGPFHLFIKQPWVITTQLLLSVTFGGSAGLPPSMRKFSSKILNVEIPTKIFTMPTKIFIFTPIYKAKVKVNILFNRIVKLMIKSISLQIIFQMAKKER